MTFFVEIDDFPAAMPKMASANGGRCKLEFGVADLARAILTIRRGKRVPKREAALDRGSTALQFRAMTTSGGLLGASRSGTLSTTSLFEALDGTEKGHISYRVSMAMATLVAQEMLDVIASHHLDPLATIGAVTLQSGRSRPDLIMFDKVGNAFVVEVKGRSNGIPDFVVDDAKQQAVRVQLVRQTGAMLPALAHIAAVADLSRAPMTMVFVDPPAGEDDADDRKDTDAGEEAAPSLVAIDEVAFHREYYSTVSEFAEVNGEPPPTDASDAEASNASPALRFARVPGTSMRLGVDRAVERAAAAGNLRALRAARDDWNKRVRALPTDSPLDHEVFSLGPDGHVLHIDEDAVADAVIDELFEVP